MLRLGHAKTGTHEICVARGGGDFAPDGWSMCLVSVAGGRTRSRGDVLSLEGRGRDTLAAMATPRSKLVDNAVALGYHLVSSCVRRAWLCGRDQRTGKDYSHRKRWLVGRMLALARCFAVEIDAYAVMSNHFHLVVHYDPKACESWSDAEVATRWTLWGRFRRQSGARWWRSARRKLGSYSWAIRIGWRGRVGRWGRCRASCSI